MVTQKRNIETLWKEFTRLLKDENQNGYPPFFYYYCRHVLDRQSFEKYILNLKFLFELAQRPIAGAKVLDVGCGFGIDSMIMCAFGAKEVCGVDVNESWVATIKKYLKDLGWDLPMKPRVADAASLPYPDNTFDVALSVEAISHYRNVDSFLVEAHRVLKKGGKLIISDANNGANPFIRRKTHEIWERFEFGPPTESFHGHRIQKSYRDMRREMLKEKFPQLQDEEVQKLVENTFAMGGDDVLAAGERYVKEGVLPNLRFRKGVPAFNPVTNDYIERLFDPTKLAKQLNHIGFRVKTFAHFGGAGKKDIVGITNTFLRLFSPLTIYAARVYKIVAVKN